MSALLAHTFVPAPPSSRGRHPHTQTVYAPSTHSHSPRYSSVHPPPRKHSNIPDDTGTTASGLSQRRLIPNARPELGETSLDYPDPNSTLSQYVSNKPSPWTPGTPPKHKSTQSDTVLCAGAAQTPLTAYPHPHQQREGVERHLSTFSSYDHWDIRSTAIPPTPLQKEHISVYLDEGISMPATPPLTKDNLQTPPSTGLLRTPPSLKDHIRSLALARTQPLTRTHSNTSSFESPGVASLSMRLDKDGRFYGHDDDDDKYTMPPSPTPTARRRKLTVPVVRVDVHEEVAVSDSELPARPRTTIETGSTTPARRRLPRRPWTSGGGGGGRGGAVVGGEVASGAPPSSRSLSSLSAFFSRNLSMGRWSDVFHLNGVVGGGHGREPSHGSVRRPDGFERLDGGDDSVEKPRRNFPLPLPLDQWELEALELGVRPTSRLTPNRPTLLSDTHLRAQTPNSSWLADPDPFAPPPRGAVTFVSSVKDREVTKFGVGESTDDFEQPQTPTRMAAWGKLVLPLPAPTPAHLPSPPSTPAASEASVKGTRRSGSNRSTKKRRNAQPDSPPVPPLPTFTIAPTIATTPTLSPPSKPTKFSPQALFHARPGLPRSASSPDVREETFPPPNSVVPKPLPALPGHSGNHAQSHEITEEALLAQKLLSKLNRDHRTTKKRRVENGAESGGETDSPEDSRTRTKSLASSQRSGRMRSGSLLTGIGKGLGMVKGDSASISRGRTTVKNAGYG
ncbi:hypothetical protein PQX77_006666 [Marasmius sp. AFHP31]|nr:hypothetical protein PQX77_006666 [Marasmius sp. AFHP31]